MNDQAENVQTKNTIPRNTIKVLSVLYLVLCRAFLLYSIPWHRELFIHWKTMLPYVQLLTNCRNSFWFNENKICIVIKLSSPQFVDTCSYGTIAFPCIKTSLHGKTKRECSLSIWCLSLQELIQLNCAALKTLL